jgi:hypothetical protein
MIYVVACTTGLRTEELATLTPESFDLDADPPTVTVAAGYTKNGQLAVQPLTPDVVEALRLYLANKPACVPIWPGTWFTRSADMLKVDLEAAGVPYVVEGPSGPLFGDFHALRHTYISMLDKAGASLKQAMQLARHSDPRLTMARYGRAQLADLGATVERLPALTTQSSPPEIGILRATGTDPVGVRGCTNGCTKVAQTVDSERDGSTLIDAPTEATDSPEMESEGNRNPLILQAFETFRDGTRGDDSAERAGFEPAVQFDPYAALAKRCYRPLSHLSGPPHPNVGG